MIRRILCWLGFHKWKKLPHDYDVTNDYECWTTIDFDNYGTLYKCKYCGKVKR